MTEEELTKFMNDNREAVLQATRSAVIEKIKDSVKWTLPDTVHVVVGDFLKNEIAPEVGKLLLEQKGVILDAAKKSAVALSDELAKRMMETVTKNLDGHRTEAVFKALLGVNDRF